MYIKLLVLIGFDLHFPLISGIYKLHQIKASFHTFQLSPQKYQIIQCQMIKNLEMIKKMYAKQLFFSSKIIIFYNKVTFTETMVKEVGRG